MQAASSYSPKRMDHYGAELVYLSAAKPERNVHIIYQAIKALPDSAILQADQDIQGRHYVFFPGGAKTLKKSDPNSRKNLAYYRNELGNILNTSALAIKKSQEKSSGKQSFIATDKLEKIATFTPSHGDFTAGLLKPVLRKIVTLQNTLPLVETRTVVVSQEKQEEIISVAVSSTAKNASIKSSNLSLENLRTRRLQAFSMQSPKELLLTRAALFDGYLTHELRQQDRAIKAMQNLVTNLLEQTTVPAKSVAILISESEEKEALIHFARHWMDAIKTSKNSRSEKLIDCLQITIFPWSSEISKLSKAVLEHCCPQHSTPALTPKQNVQMQNRQSALDDSSTLVESSTD